MEQEALEMGFATKLVEAEEKEVATQSIRAQLLQKITKEPEKVPVANVRIDENMMKEIIQNEIKRLEQRLTNQQEPKQNKEIINKPLEMMKAIFNVKNKEEDE